MARQERLNVTVPLTIQAGSFVSKMKGRSLSAQTEATIRRGFIDTVAVMIQGWNEASTRIVRQHSTADAAGRAVAYSAAAHALDYDDTFFAGHPSAVLVPTILALAEDSPLTSDTMFCAYAAGYEVWAHLARCEADPLHDKGWHPSGVYGPLAAAAAAAVIGDCVSETAQHAIAIAASMAGGITANFGSMTKPYQLARAAQSGIIAVTLARAGLTASSDAIEHPSGFLSAISPRGRITIGPLMDPSRPLLIDILGLNVKLLPICYGGHRVADAAREIHDRAGFDFGSIERVEIEIGRHLAGVLRYHDPHNPTEAKFSAEFAVVATLLTGRCSADELSDYFIRRPDIRDLIKKCVIILDHSEDTEETGFSPFDRVAIVLADGNRLTSNPIRRPRGHFSDPATDDEMWQKFSECTNLMLDEEHAARLFEKLRTFKSIEEAVEILPSNFQLYLTGDPTTTANS